jgi:hypothetical protein
VLGDDPLAEPLERERRRLRRKPPVALAEGLEEPEVPLREPLGQLLLEPAVERALRRVSPQQHERVVGDAHKWRREHRGQRLVVVAVVEEAQVGEQVDHLLLVVVVATGRAEGRQADCT